MLIFKGCLLSWGANKHMYFSGSVWLCGNGLAVIYFRPRVSFSGNFCPLFIAIDQSLLTPPTNVKRLEPTNP